MRDPVLNTAESTCKEELLHGLNPPCIPTLKSHLVRGEHKVQGTLLVH